VRWLVLLAACGRAAAQLPDAGVDTLPSPDAVTVDTPPAPRGTFRNPLNTGPDPFLVYDGAYYLATTQGDAVRIWSAPSLAGLAVAQPTVVWQDTDPSRNQDVWAPAIYHLDGHWYVYYTADDGTDDHHRIYVIEADAPLGPYHFKAKLEAPNATELWAIDPAILEQAAGRYLVWSGAGTEGHNLLYIAPLSNPWTVSGPRLYLPAEGGCSEVREAPSILQHAGTTFLVYSTCDTGKPDYQLWSLTIPTASDPMQPTSWTQQAGAVFARADAAGVWGPGSSAFFRSPDGTEDWIAFHAKNTSQYTYDFRTTRAQSITWSGDTPVLGSPHAAGDTLDLPSGDPGRSTYFIDDDGTATGPGTVTFSSGWTAYPSCGVQCFRGGDHGTATTGATATWQFTGTQIALYSARDTGNGIATFSLDGGAATTGDYYAAIRQGEQLVYTSPPLPLGAHTLQLTVTGSHDASSGGPAISVDRAEVYAE
jgi:GH43 family beta-xylosidase